MKSQKRYLKTYMGFTSGSFNGRDDGYPELKTRVFESLAELAEAPTIEGEVIYDLSPCDAGIVRQIAKEREKQARQKDADALAKKEAEFEKLRKELGK